MFEELCSTYVDVAVISALAGDANDSVYTCTLAKYMQNTLASMQAQQAVCGQQ